MPDDVGADVVGGLNTPTPVGGSDLDSFSASLSGIPGERDVGVFRAQGPSAPGRDAGMSAPAAAGDTNTGAGAAEGGAAGAGAGDDRPRGDGGVVSGNPAAVNILVGTGRLGELLGVNRDGVRFGGLNITDNNGILAGGLGPGKWAVNSLTIADLSVNLEERYDWKGGLVGTQFLYYGSGSPGYSIAGIEQGKHSPNALAGTVMGFESLDVVPPFNRAELYQLWYR